MVWEGASLWMLEGAHESAELDPHAHHAIQITFLLKGAFEVRIGEESLGGPIAAVASDARHGFGASGAVAFLFVAPESAAGRALTRELFGARPGAAVTSDWAASALEKLRGCFAAGGGEAELRALGREIMAMLPAAPAPLLPDRRVLAMIAYAAERLGDAISLPAAAAHVHLSPSRARHLFAAQTGLPFKTYVLWLRIERAVALYAEGRSLTEAAHEAGFADSAHFSRTFRRTFGLPAAALRLGGG